jgi:hypothetical protein
MRNWKKKVHFRDLLDDYNSRADELQEIKRVKPLWEERFNSISELKHFVPSLKKVKTLSRFNAWINDVYDFCDDNNIWVEL